MAPLFFRCLFLGLLLLAIPSADAEAAKKSSRTLLALDVFDLNLDIDSTMDIGGETRFFSSRPNRYAGARIVIHSGGRPDDSIYFGSFSGFMWGKSSFLLNWEEPGLQSFPPLDASISTFAWPVGMDLNLRLGGILTIAPYASAKLMWHHLTIEIADEDFSGNAFKLAFDAGCKVSLKLGGLAIAGGAGLTHILNDEIKFEVDDLNFDSRTSGSSPEYFLGVEL